MVGLGVTGAGNCGGASSRIFTSWGPTNSATSRRPPLVGHCRLYNAFRVAMASSTEEYYKKTRTEIRSSENSLVTDIVKI